MSCARGRSPEVSGPSQLRCAYQRLPRGRAGNSGASVASTLPPAGDHGDYLVTSVRPWRPTWLDFDDAVDAYPASRQLRGTCEPVPADPVWAQATAFEQYRSLEQREAVRTLVTSAEDATVLVVLSTGSGKSLVGLLHPLTVGVGSTTVVVVPTTSLAIDQEEQLRSVLRRRDAPDADVAFAWHGGLDAEVRGQLLTRISEGGQRAVFTSPEALFGTLGDLLAEVAAAGRIGQFVVDEAHMVATWGTDFRPDFQALAGFRRRLRVAAHRHPFRTVLMSATITGADVETLTDLFVETGQRLILAGAPALRPEIGYLTAEAPDAVERLRRVCEAVLHLPRPVFVYATRREDVALLVDAFRAHGFQRLVVVTGDSSDSDRREAVAALRGRYGGGRPTADLAVGTSAFGLGIDVPDVRAVVHACLPETLDRYFQEVGRAARDGRAALGLLLWTRSDIDVARSVSDRRVIGIKLARERWAAMKRAAELDGNMFWVPLRALRIGLDDESQENEKWNSRTLSSMVRAGFVRLAGSRRDADGGASIGVVPLRGDLNAAATWDAFSAMRITARQRAEASLDAVRRLARDGRVCDALVPVYTVQDRDRLTADLVVHDTCGGCAGCYPPRPAPVPPLPVQRPPGPQLVPPRLALLPMRDDGVALAVADDDGRWGRDAGRLIMSAAAAGVRQLVVDADVRAHKAVDRTLRDVVLRYGLAAPIVTILAPTPTGDEDLDLLPQVPTLLLLAPGSLRSELPAILRVLPRPTIAVLSTIQPSDVREDMTVRQMFPGTPDLPSMIDMVDACRI